MIFKKVESKRAPKPGGCYSQAIQIGNLIFTSGQLPVNPISGKFISSDVEKQVIRVLENIKNILEDNGSSLNHVIKSTIFISNIKHWNIVNEIYAKYFKNSLPPARSIITCSSIHHGLDIEMEVVAFIP
jgi:2-iminobutanoate/2-iminopropanoate deaminase